MAVRTLQDHPGFLVQAWRLTAGLLRLSRGAIRKLGLEASSRGLVLVEEPMKRLLFSCQMCGQCVLHRTGMTCPMTCPKEIRNGPCGGVLLDGTCEVDGETPCVWVEAVARAARTPYAGEIGTLNGPVDWQLEGLSSWATYAIGRDQVGLAGDATPRHIDEVVRRPAGS